MTIASLPTKPRRLFRIVVALAVTSCTLGSPATGTAQEVPLLVHSEASNTLYQASSSIESYTSTEVSASLQIYPFRPFTGDLKQVFGSTLLRDWIDPKYRETAVDGMPTFNSGTLPGAEAVYGAQFTDKAGGLPHPRLRLAILAKGAVALVDASAASALAWQRAWPSMQALLASLKVEGGAPSSTTGPPASEGAAAIATGVAGIFAGITTRTVSDLTRGPGYLLRQRAVLYYLFSANGLVYRTFEQPNVTSGDVSRFNFGDAARQDPDNSGTYSVTNGLLTLHLGGSQREIVTGKMTSAHTLLIDSVTYEREH